MNKKLSVTLLLLVGLVAICAWYRRIKCSNCISSLLLSSVVNNSTVPSVTNTTKVPPVVNTTHPNINRTELIMIIQKFI